MVDDQRDLILVWVRMLVVGLLVWLPVYVVTVLGMLVTVLGMLVTVLDMPVTVLDMPVTAKDSKATGPSDARDNNLLIVS